MPAELTDPSTSSFPEVRYKGVAASPGIALGPVVFLGADEQIVRKRRIRPEEVDKEADRFEQALIKTRQQIIAIRNEWAESNGEEDTSIFDAHILVLEDGTVIQAVKEYVQSRLINVEFAYDQIVRSYVRKMRELNDDYFRERAGDFLDVSRRVLRNLQGIVQLSPLHHLESPSVLLAHDLTPSDTAGLDRSLILGIVTEAGSRTSHSAILARQLNLPVIVSLRDLIAKVEVGTEVLVDGYEGLFIVSPTEETKAEYSQRKRIHHDVDVKLDQLRETLAVTLDNRRITVSANVEILADLPLIQENGAEGIGLLRTEYIFLNQERHPSEDEQESMYAAMARASQPHFLIIRTLDIGGDKKRAHLGIEAEVNPFLGFRGIRFSLGRPEVFRVQLRAICRASKIGNIRVMFPMISDVGELRAAKVILQEVQNELRAEGHVLPDKIEVGVMIEVPSAALTADILAREVDFFSVGSNDLIQYTLAIDRGNENVAAMYQPMHPAILRLLQTVVEAAHRHNIWVGVCGEMASDAILIPALVGLGIDELSTGATSIPRIKRAIQAVRYEDCRQLVQHLAQSDSGENNYRQLSELAQRLYPEIIQP